MNEPKNPILKQIIHAILAIAALCLPAAIRAQEMDPNMPGMDHGKMTHDMSGMDHSGHRGTDQAAEDDDCVHSNCGIMAMPPRILDSAQGSGTSRLPGKEGAMHGLHIMPGGDWMLMLHGTLSTQYTKATGPRGDEKLYATSMAMASAEKETGWGRVQGRAMMSLEPLMKHDGYPSLFATGEEAYGAPIVDRQHPHDLFMELSARVDVNVGENASAFLYAGPVAEPALGPSAFMHRGSARLNPEAPITHHWFDSTHITYGVVTAGIATPTLQLEASAFRGREPDEFRFNIETPKLDSWSVRATWNPSPKWALQVSHGFLKTPEAGHPGENEHRTTASAHFANGGGLSAMAAFSAKKHAGASALTAWLAEANWDIGNHHTFFGRAENLANEELFPNPLDPLHEQRFRVSKFQAGYAYRLPIGSGPFNLALGGSVSTFAKPAALDAAYGKNPAGYTLFAKISLGH